MAAPGRRSLLACLLAGAVLALGRSPLGAEGAPDAASRAMARALYDEARGLSEAGDWPSAAALLSEARSHDGLDSDIRFLSALASRKLGEPVGHALGELDAGLASGRFSDYLPDEARLLKAELLATLRLWNESLSALEPRSPEPSLDARWALARSRALLGARAVGPCLAELERALRRHPDDPELPRLVLSRAASGPLALPGSDGLRSLVALALVGAKRCADSDPELPVLAAPFEPDRAAAADAVAAFRASGGKSAAATLLALEYGLADEARAASELFSGSYPARLADVERALTLARNPAGKAAIASALAAFSGRIEADRDGDGLAEETVSVRKGLASAYSSDRDQDGEPDLLVSFAEGLPVKAELASGFSAIYGEYPYLASATIGRGGTTYDLEPGILAYEPVRMSRIAGEGRAAVFLPFPTEEGAPTERALASVALSRRELRDGEEDLAYLDRGVPTRLERRREGRLYSTTDYVRGRPVLEKADLDGDGRFETERGYDASASAAVDAIPGDNGESLAWAKVDADGDGLFEYREEARFPFRKEWDLDRDGSADAVEYRLADGALRCEYSSRLDGTLDEILTFRDGSIVALTKGGSELALVPDSNPEIVWIGKKPFDLGPGFDCVEGLHSRQGARFRLAKGDRRFFAELLP